jgi:hypothetical protein
LINAAALTDVFLGQSVVFQFDEPFEPDPCPAIAIDGNRVTLTGGCTTQTTDPIQVEGTATVTNPMAWGDIIYDFSEDSTYEYAGFAITESGFRTSYDGRFTIASNYESIDADLTVDSFGVVIRSDVYAECSRSQTVTCDIDNSGLELVGVGGALVSGNIAAGGTSASSSFTLRGADTLRVEQSGGCVEWWVEGTDRMSPTMCP